MKLARQRPEPDAAPRFAYCEPSHATTVSATHIRTVGPEGLMTGGGVPTPALCGRDLRAGWDLRSVTARTLAEVRVDYDPNWPGHVCRTCRDLAREILETQP